jgi:hypothetical protein
MNKNMNTKMIQQGDTLARKINSLPSNVRLISSNKIEIAHGENGHSHVIDSPNTELYEDDNKNRYFVNNNEFVVPSLHEEHKPITYSPGIHQLGQVREYDYFTEMERKVTD